MKRIKYFILLLVFASMAQSCQKDEIGVTNTTVIDSGPIQTTESSVSGLVTDMAGDPLADVTVQHRGDFFKTDENGYFKVENAIASEGGGLLKFNQEGYFKNYKWYYPLIDDQAFVRVMMIKEEAIGTISISNGGTLTMNGGAKVTFPTDAFEGVSGSEVEIFAHWYDPTGDNLGEEMPGDLRGIDREEALVQLATYGMVAVEIRDDAGNDIQLKEGITATLEFPVPSELLADAPETIKTWSLDEDRAYWIEEGEATLSGDKYIAEVSHFSFWNCDAPFPVIYFQGRLVDSQGNPLQNMKVCITDLARSNTRVGWTSYNGVFCGKLPKDTPLKIEVKDNCGGFVYQGEIGPFDSDIDLGDIVVDGSDNIKVTGQLACNGIPFSNGYVLLTLNNGNNYVVETDANGNFEYYLNYCSVGKISVKGFNNETNASSDYVTFENPGNELNVGFVEVCDGATTEDEYINIKLDNGTLTLQESLLSPSANVVNGELLLGTESNNGYAGIKLTDVAVGTNSVLLDLFTSIYYPQQTLDAYCDNIQSSCDGLVVDITRYEDFIGGYVEGTIMGTAQNEVGEPINVMIAFRVIIDDIRLERTISGVVWNDTNNDGIRDANDTEPSPPNFSRVTLYINGAPMVNTFTNPGDGSYSFTVSEGNYSLEFSRPNGYIYTLQNQGTDDSIDSDVNPNSGLIDLIVVTSDPSADYSNYDVGLYYDGNIECEYGIINNPSCGNDNGRFFITTGDDTTSTSNKYTVEVYHDQILVSDATFSAYIQFDNVPATEVSFIVKDDAGNEICSNTFTMQDEALDCIIYPYIYCEGNIYIGVIEFECSNWNPNGYTYLWSDGSTEQVIEDVIPGIYSLTLTDASGCSGEYAVDFSDVQEPSIFGFVWEDNPLYNDNVYDAGLEQYVSGVTVNLYFEGDLTMAIQSTVTTPNGYSFTNLQSGQAYVIGVEAPMGFDFVTFQDPDASPNQVKSDVSADEGFSEPILIELCNEERVNAGVKPE